MIGTALSGKGGIAAVVSVLDQDGLFAREGVRYLATHADGTRAAKARVALAGFWRTALACLTERPAVVHAHSASHASFFRKSLLLLIARRCGARTVFHLHGGGFRDFATRESGALARWWIRHTLEASSVVIALSAGWAAFLAGFAPRATVRVVPNAVDVARLASASAEEAGRVLFLGRAEPAKGVYELLAAVAALAPRFPALRLALGGDGDLALLRTRAAQLGIAERLDILGWIGPQDKADQLARAAVFCLPSHAEGLPMALLEAMAVGKAVLVSDVGAIPEAVTDGDNGLLVAPRDVAALAAALERLLSDHALRRRLGAHARQTVAERFSTAVVGATLSGVYRELCQGDLR
ncbi:glycosyltransferase family 4 protein [Massilia sp. R798]|uniref:Glycosyltransferase family 4 protein n=2 Tax=Massilia soli TaxID=2792854 RepID=A0ABS7SKW6_9BURK|nr:glycosyltransferase family 4 protein [Massilia soli]